MKYRPSAPDWRHITKRTGLQRSVISMYYERHNADWAGFIDDEVVYCIAMYATLAVFRAVFRVFQLKWQ